MYAEELQDERREGVDGRTVQDYGWLVAKGGRVECSWQRRLGGVPCSVASAGRPRHAPASALCFGRHVEQSLASEKTARIRRAELVATLLPPSRSPYRFLSCCPGALHQLWDADAACLQRHESLRLYEPLESCVQSLTTRDEGRRRRGRPKSGSVNKRPRVSRG